MTAGEGAGRATPSQQSRAGNHDGGGI